MAKYKNRKEAEKALIEEYVNHIVEVKYFSHNQRKTYVGRLNRLSIEDANRNPAIVILIFNENKKFEVDSNVFFDMVTKL